MTCARTFIGSLFEETKLFKEGKNIVLDGAIDLYAFKRQMNYFPNAKMIIVDRDPRDMYADLLTGQFIIGQELSKTHDWKIYVRYFKHNRPSEEVLQAENVLQLHFEDLVLHYDMTVKRIMDFLGLEEKDHVNSKKFFDPAISKKKVGLWKTKLNEEEKAGLAKELAEYLNQ
jgi:hypothetical protein